MVGNGIHRASDFSVKWLRTDGCTMLTPAEPTRHGVTSWYRPDDCERVIEVIPTGGGGGSAAASAGAITVVTPGGLICPTCGQVRP